MDLKEGDKIEVYRNLHKKCFSVRISNNLDFSTNRDTIEL
jgi:putative ubiquitin-RnfH superfamily antitoxin RatB of RatAB toxin-antitoxin module